MSPVYNLHSRFYYLQSTSLSIDFQITLKSEIWNQVHPRLYLPSPWKRVPFGHQSSRAVILLYKVTRQLRSSSSTCITYSLSLTSTSCPPPSSCVWWLPSGCRATSLCWLFTAGSYRRQPLTSSSWPWECLTWSLPGLFHVSEVIKLVHVFHKVQVFIFIYF